MILTDSVEIHDGFCSRIDEIVKESELAAYKDYSFVNGAYRGICVRAGRSALEKEFLGRFMVKFEYFRRYEKGMAQDTFIHSDLNLSDYTAILSLKDDNGQLAFWKHKSTGWLFPEILEPDSLMELSFDGQNENAWECINMIEMKKNRCVIYPAKFFHSRYPKDWVCDTPRVVLVFFMNQSSLT